MPNVYDRAALAKETAKLQKDELALKQFEREEKDSLIACQKTRQDYQLGKVLINPSATNGWCLEKEISCNLERKFGPSMGTMVPLAAFARDLTALGNASQLITQNATGRELLPFLYNRSVVLKAGATVLQNLTSTMSIPRQTAQGEPEWLGENASIGSTDMQFEAVTSTPKRVSVQATYSKQLRQQSLLDVAQFVRQDLLSGLAVAIDQAALSGTGSPNVPLGILNYSTTPSSGYGWVNAVTYGFQPV